MRRHQAGREIPGLEGLLGEQGEGGGIFHWLQEIHRQQLARTLLFTPDERYEQSYERKVREAILAAALTAIGDM